MGENDHAADVGLVRAILDGSTPAWHEFVDRYRPGIEAILRRKLYDREEARDVFVQLLGDLLHRKLASYRGDAALSSWLAVVARRAAADAIRRRLGRRRLDRSPGASERAAYLAQFLRTERERREAGTPERALFEAERERLVRSLPAMIEALPEIDRRAIVLRFEEGLSALGVAREMGLANRRKAYTVIDRALRRLRRMADSTGAPD